MNKQKPYISKPIWKLNKSYIFRFVKHLKVNIKFVIQVNKKIILKINNNNLSIFYIFTLESYKIFV